MRTAAFTTILALAVAMLNPTKAADTPGNTGYRYNNTGRTSGYYSNATPAPDNRNGNQRPLDVMEPYYTGPLYNAHDSLLPPKYPPAKGSSRSPSRK
ncbi:hypothetical protein H4R34_000007 [Dimargaris verticillata]|uniref:Uncharacterized protein n=1 Tax=Dimargaris verticillata TaxID=2761393 RepID=A0A9W8BCG8_9FUNG|nr:hypothetical protein H4R34_000007 [Dimargaris verticillata]